MLCHKQNSVKTIVPRIFAALILLGAISLSAQIGSTASSQTGSGGPAADTTSQGAGESDLMQAPPQVSGQAYSTSMQASERSNYLQGGVSFISAYTDNALAGANGAALSDISNSIAGSIALDESTPRMHSTLSYAPGYTFYQRITSRDESDQNASINFQYLLSPHLTFSARDSLQKSSSAFNQPDLSSQPVSGGITNANFSVIAPIADLLRNSGNVGMNYQFALNGMVGVNGSASNLHYPNASEVPGLFDSSNQSGSGFYTTRISRVNYLGASYQYQRLVSYPTEGANETRTQGVTVFYTYTPNSRFSASFFAGPQHSDTVQPAISGIPIPETKAWSPAFGGSMNWMRNWMNLAVSYSHTISGGSGLVGAVHMDGGAVTTGQRISKTLSTSISAAYTQNKVIGAILPGASNGHSITGTASLTKQLGQSVGVQLGYSRLHQDYAGESILSANPDTNREFISISYHFARPLGR